MSEWLGWAATAVFFGSYFCRQQQRLRVVQMVGATMWGVYGLLIGATPVVVANVLVCGAAVWTYLRDSRANAAVVARAMQAQNPGAPGLLARPGRT